jgi:hypothetical protein
VNASKKEFDQGSAAEALIAATMRNRYRRQADPPAGGPDDADARADTGEITDPSEDAHADTRVRAGVEALADAPQIDAEARTRPSEAQEADEDPPRPLKPSQGPRRMLEVKARAYMGGWRKLRPRAETLAAAARDVLAVGGSAAEVRGLLAEVGVTPDAMPPEVKEALRKR